MDDQNPGSSRSRQLRKALENRGFRHGYMARQLKAFLAQQIRALRGEMRQAEFGEKIGKPQSVVSRLEKQMDKQISVQTLIDVASALDIAVLIRFVDFDTFLLQTEDVSETALAPESYDAMQETGALQANLYSFTPTTYNVLPWLVGAASQNIVPWYQSVTLAWPFNTYEQQSTDFAWAAEVGRLREQNAQLLAENAKQATRIEQMEAAPTQESGGALSIFLGQEGSYPTNAVLMNLPRGVTQRRALSRLGGTAVQ